MSENKGHRRHGHNRHRHDKKHNLGDTGRHIIQQIDENNKTMIMFKAFANELDSKHDLYEDLVKISRNITIESKRIISLLHNATRQDKRDSILSEANDRLTTLINQDFQKLAKLLDGHDHYQYVRAYTPGLQEFLEALTFYEYIFNSNIPNFSHVVKKLEYTVPVSDLPHENQSQQEMKTVYTLVPASEYLLGLGDLTGELMRKCINSLGSGILEDCFQTCYFVKEVYKGFLLIGNTQGYKELGRKTYVLKQSLVKMELVCYNIKVRGSEIPKHMLADVITAQQNNDGDEDEGFY